MNLKQPQCHFVTDCFAYRNGFCICLNDTKFKGGGCPFYKSKKRYNFEIKRAKKEK